MHRVGELLRIFKPPILLIYYFFLSLRYYKGLWRTIKEVNHFFSTTGYEFYGVEMVDTNNILCGIVTDNGLMLIREKRFKSVIESGRYDMIYKRITFLYISLKDRIGIEKN